MKLAMAQMSMSGSMDENLKKSLAFCDAAAGSDLLFFPEVQLTPFFPQYAGRNVDAYAVPADSPTVQAFADKAKERGLYLSPNMYLEQEGKRYDASLWLTPEGELRGCGQDGAHHAGGAVLRARLLHAVRGGLSRVRHAVGPRRHRDLL